MAGESVTEVPAHSGMGSGGPDPHPTSDPVPFEAPFWTGAAYRSQSDLGNLPKPEVFDRYLLLKPVPGLLQEVNPGRHVRTAA